VKVIGQTVAPVRRVLKGDLTLAMIVIVAVLTLVRHHPLIRRRLLKTVVGLSGDLSLLRGSRRSYDL
jgi:hypothetical protein